MPIAGIGLYEKWMTGIFSQPKIIYEKNIFNNTDFHKNHIVEVSAQESNSLIPEIRNLILKTGTNQQDQMTETVTLRII